MRAPKLLIVLLALGTVGGFASGFRSVARHHYYKTHGGYGQECGSKWGRGYNGHGWQQHQNVAPTPTPVIVEKVVEKPVAAPVVTPVVTPTTNNPTVNIYVNGQPQGQAQPVGNANTPTGDPQTR